MAWSWSAAGWKHARSADAAGSEAFGASHAITAPCSSEWIVRYTGGGSWTTPASHGDGSCGPEAGGVDGYVDSRGGSRTASPMWARARPPAESATTRPPVHPAA